MISYLRKTELDHHVISNKEHKKIRIMKNLFLAILLVLVSFSTMAQAGKLKKANNYYEKVAYAEASVLYNELSGSKHDSPEMQSKLANCFYQMGETLESEKFYAKIVSTDNKTSEDVYNYAMSLKENGKYTESDKWMAKFHTMTGGDSRGKEFNDNSSYLDVIDAQGEYFSVKHLSINTEHADFGGYPMSGDKVYFVSNRKKRISVQRTHTYNNKKFLDLYSADVNEGNLENPVFHGRNTNKKFHEGPVCFAPNNNMVYFTRNNMDGGKKRRDQKGIQNLKIYSAEIDSEGNWTNEKELPINSKDYSVGHPAISSDGKTMYFASDMPGGLGGADIYKMSINKDGTYGSPENLGSNINTEGQEMFPWITEEELLFFASDGHLGLGGLDVFVMLPNKDGSFKKLMNVGKPINTPKDDFALIMNVDNLTGFVSSNRANGSGDDDIYGFTLLKPLKVNLSVKGVVTDIRSNEILPGATVNLLDIDGNVLATTIANESAGYEFGVEPDLDYTISATKNDYFDNKTSFTTVNLPSDVEVLEEDVALEKDPGLALHAIVADAKSKQPLEGVSMIITDNFSGEEFANMTTNEAGDFLKGITGKSIDDRLSYNIQLVKEGYFPKTVTFNHKITEPGIIDVHNILDGGLFLDKEVTDLAQLVKINPINFDLNKYNIRPDAQVELDKIVEVMNKYPGMEVELGSHTDCRASKAYNRKLSDRRAKASAAYIKTKITNPERIYGKGYGEEFLLNGCECEGSVKSDCSEEEHEKNRRTEFKVLKTGADDLKVINTSTDSFNQ